MSHPREEIEAAIQRYVAVRERIDAGDGTWADLAEFFTDDAVFIDPAWGRVEGIDEMRATVFGDAMVGLEDWKFPVEFYAIDGDNVVVKWKQILPGARPDGSPWVQSGVSTLVYAGDGKFGYEEDLLNMVHVLEDMRERVPRPRRRDAAASPEPRFLAAVTRPDAFAVSAGLLRCASGVSFLVAPEAANRLWGDAEDAGPTASLLLRSMGYRDALIGGLLLTSGLRGSRTAAGWFLASAGADAADLLGGLANHERMSTQQRVRGLGGAAIGIAVGVFGAARVLRASRG